jgi:hypothetical protein
VTDVKSINSSLWLFGNIERHDRLSRMWPTLRLEDRIGSSTFASIMLLPVEVTKRLASPVHTVFLLPLIHLGLGVTSTLFYTLMDQVRESKVSLLDQIIQIR